YIRGRRGDRKRSRPGVLNISKPTRGEIYARWSGRCLKTGYEIYRGVTNCRRSAVSCNRRSGYGYKLVLTYNLSVAVARCKAWACGSTYIYHARYTGVHQAVWLSCRDYRLRTTKSRCIKRVCCPEAGVL